MPLVTRTGQVSFAPKGDKGDKGARMRMRVWGASVSYLEGKQGQQFYDIVLYDNLLYLCIRSHTSVSTETPKQNVASGKIKYWEVAQSWTFIATKLLLTEKIKASMIDADGIRAVNVDISGKITADSGRIGPFSIDSGMLSSKTLYEGTDSHVGFNLSAGQIEFYNERTFARVKIGGNTKFVTIEGISYDAGIDIQSPNAMIGMHIKTLSIPLFVEGGNIFLHPNNDSYVSLHGIVGNWRNISVSTSLNNNDDNVMFINTGNIEVTLPPDVPGHTIYFKRMSGGVRLTGGRILPAPGGKEMSSIDLDYASGFVKCMGNYWVMFYCGEQYLIKNIMKVDFTKFPLFTGIDRQDMVIADIRKDIADGIYRNVPGLPAHVLAEKIYRNELVELADDEIHILDLYTSASVGQLADSWQDYKKNNLETGK